MTSSGVDATRVIVCGGRDYDDILTVFQVLNELRPKEIAQGGAAGADTLAREWAAFGAPVPCRTFPADWSRYGRSAGPRRNRQMLDEFNPTLVVAFPGGRGTADMVRQARERGVHVIVVKDESKSA